MPRMFFHVTFLCLFATGCFAPAGVSHAPGISNSGIPLAPGAEQVKVTLPKQNTAAVRYWIQHFIG